jgi:hypothetical protein
MRSGPGWLTVAGGRVAAAVAGRGEPGPGVGQEIRARQHARRPGCPRWRRPVCLIWSPVYRGVMAETQREPVPRVDSGELDTARAFLLFARHCVLITHKGASRHP